MGVIGNAFRRRREHRGLTQADVVSMLSIGHAAVVKYELGTLYRTMNGQLEKLDALNRRWTLEDYEKE